MKLFFTILLLCGGCASESPDSIISPPSFPRLPAAQLPARVNIVPVTSSLQWLPVAVQNDLLWPGEMTVIYTNGDLLYGSWSLCQSQLSSNCNVFMIPCNGNQLFCRAANKL